MTTDLEHDLDFTDNRALWVIDMDIDGFDPDSDLGPVVAFKRDGFTFVVTPTCAHESLVLDVRLYGGDGAQIGDMVALGARRAVS